MEDLPLPVKFGAPFHIPTPVHSTSRANVRLSSGLDEVLPFQQQPWHIVA